MDDFKKAMSQFTTGITIISTNIDNRPHFMTANSFTSIEYNPNLILISLMNSSKTLSNIKKTFEFGVSVLSENQKDLADKYAGKNPAIKHVPVYKFENSFPVIYNALVNLYCEIYDSYKVANHTLIIGLVKEIKINDESSPLIYFNRKYGGI